MAGLLNLPWWQLGAGALLGSLPLLFIALHRRLAARRRAHLRSNLAQLRLLRALLGDFQRHRGLSSGLLAGDESLHQPLAATRDALARNLDLARGQTGTHDWAWQALIEQWCRLRDDRPRDAAESLLLHHQIIRDCIFLIEDVATELDLGAGRVGLQYLPFIWRDVVQTAEWGGQARAIGTGVAAAGRSSAEQRIRLRFLSQKIRQQSEVAFGMLQRELQKAPQTHGFDLPRCEKTVRDFLHCLETELLEREPPGIDAQAYFQRATEAINALLGLVDATLEQLQRIHGGR